jgi:RhoGAP domain
MNGCEEEGLYRIPGSGRDVKHWQRRFDTEHDINLFDEPELYDINTIGSMFKAWLRDLPDEIFPKQVQIKIAEQCMGATKTPQLLRDELSKLPPFNYYLLFAITCHLSLLHSFADKNKMDYRNLCICFQPCLRIDGFCFQFLVQDWKNCWQGCWTEKEYLEEEYRVQAECEDTESQLATNDADDRAVSSSGSSQHHPTIPPQQQTQQQQQQQQQQQKAPKLLRKENHNPPRPATRPTIIKKGSDNNNTATSNTTTSTTNSNGNLTKSSSVSTEDQQCNSTSTTTSTTSTTTTTTVTSDPNMVHVKIESKLPALNPLSPIKL